MDCSIIIVTWNSSDYIGGCLESINKSSKNIKKEIILIDNCSMDNTIEKVKKYQVHLIESKENKGFSRANNIGIKIAKGKYILLLNPDTIIKENTIQMAYNYMENNIEVGILGARLLTKDGQIQIPCVTTFRNLWDELCIQLGLTFLFPKNKIFARYPMRYFDDKRTQDVDVVSGAFLFIRNTVIKQIGLLDSKIFLYGEEEDYCKRAKKNGWKVVYNANVEITHIGGASTKKMHSLLPKLEAYKSMDYLSKKYHTFIQLTLFRFFRIIGITLRLICISIYMLIKRDRSIQNYINIYKKALLLQFGILLEN